MRRSKKVILVENFTGKIKNGEIRAGGYFPSIGEMTRKYKISNGTAAKVIADLSRIGLISVSRGRRAIVSATPLKDPELLLKGPVGIVSSGMNMFNDMQWRNWLLHYIQRAMLLHGHKYLWYPENSDVNQLAENFSGIIFTGECVPVEQWRELLKMNCPCVKLSFCCPAHNTLYIDMHPVMNRVAIKVVAANCRKIITLATSDQEAKSVFEWYSKIKFVDTMAEYGFKKQDFIQYTFNPELPDTHQAVVEAVIRQPEKALVLITSPILYDRVQDLLRQTGASAGCQYELLVLNCAARENMPENYIDIKCEQIVEKMLQIFYGHCKSGRLQAGDVVYPELKERIDC